MCICRAEVAPPNKKLLFSQPKKKKKRNYLESLTSLIFRSAKTIGICCYNSEPYSAIAATPLLNLIKLI